MQNKIPYNIKNFLLDLIFPRFCLGCQKEIKQKIASFICENCLNNIPLNGVECHVCGLRTAEGACLPAQTGRTCRSKTSLKGLFAAGKYENPILREAINKFKYNSIESLKKPLAELVIKYLEKEKLASIFADSVLVPIPLTWRRKINRGFNQSELLAKELSPILNCHFMNLLKRQKFNAPQAKIQDWKERKENISGAFALSSEFFKLSPSYPLFTRCRTSDITSDIISKLRIILVDDVATSGATLEEAARVLKEAGIKEVYGLVIAKG